MFIPILDNYIIVMINHGLTTSFSTKLIWILPKTYWLLIKKIDI